MKVQIDLDTHSAAALNFNFVYVFTSSIHLSRWCWIREISFIIGAPQLSYTGQRLSHSGCLNFKATATKNYPREHEQWNVCGVDRVAILRDSFLIILYFGLEFHVPMTSISHKYLKISWNSDCAPYFGHEAVNDPPRILQELPILENNQREPVF